MTQRQRGVDLAPAQVRRVPGGSRRAGLARGAHALVAVWVVAISVAAGIAAAPATAASATLTIDPLSVAAGQGQTFAVQVVQEAPVAASGAQASIDFDPRILAVVSVERGAGYASAPIFEPADLGADIRRANQTGHLAQVAAAFTPPDSVPAGKVSFLIVRFHVVGCGQTVIGLPTAGPFNAEMISGRSVDYGAAVHLATIGGQVTTCVQPSAVTAADIQRLPRDSGGSVLGGLPTFIAGLAALVVAGALGGLVWRARQPGGDR